MALATDVRIAPADLGDARVIALLDTHARLARAETAPGSAHALDVAALLEPEVAVWVAWCGDEPAGTAALRVLGADHGEVKAMHTAATHRRRGIGRALLQHLVERAEATGLARISLETGSWAYFAPARAFYAKHGFVPCGPFGGYREDPNSVFLTRRLYPARRGAG